MKKILQEKGSIFKKITSWILVMAILFTSVDMSAFVVGAEDQEPIVFSDDTSASDEADIQQEDNPAAEEQQPTEPQLTEPQISFEEEVADIPDISDSEPVEEEEETAGAEDIFSDGSEETPSVESGNEQTESGNLTVKIFDDANKNGVWDEGEAGIRDLEVNLLSQNTEETIQLPSVSDGVYAMDGVQEGIYEVRLSAAPEIIAPYNLAESVNLSPDKAGIRFPDIEDTWFLSWTDIDVPQTGALLLGLQRDNLEEIEQEIGDAENVELQETEDGVFFSANASARSVTAHGFLVREHIYYNGHKVDVYYDDGDPYGFTGCPTYRWAYRNDGGRATLYCIEPFVDGLDRGNYYGGGNMATIYGAERARYMQLCSYYGADYKWPGITDGNVKALYFMAAQNLIWKKMGAQHLQWYQYKGDYHGHFHPGYAINVSYYENQIINKINNHSKMPSLPANQKIDHGYTNPDKVYAFTDSNGALGDGWKRENYDIEGWWVKSIPAGVNKAWIEGNQLKFTLKNDPSYDGKTITFPLEKRFSPRGKNQFYISNNPRQQSLLDYGVPSNIPYNWTVKINPTGQMKIRKVDDAGNPVPGVTFQWGTSRTNLPNTTAPTGKDGTVTIRASEGVIYVQEKDVPEHMIKDPAIKSVRIQNGQIATVTFTNTRVTRRATLKKINASTKEPIGGAEFRYWNEEKPDKKYKGVTDSNGEFTPSVKFPVGSRVTMEEIQAAPGYEFPTGNAQKTITISMDESQNIFEFENVPKSVPVKFKKLNDRTGKPVKGGVKFKVGTDLSQPDSYEYVVTGADGTAQTKNTYFHGTEVFYQEIEAPSGFKVDDKVYSFIVDAEQPDRVYTVIVRDRENPIGFSIRKKGDDGRALSGVRFRLEKKSGSNWYTIYSDLVTDKTGRLNIPGTYDRQLIAEGRLRLVEEETVTGYELLEKPFVFDEKYADSENAQVEVTIINNKIPTSVQIYKVDADQRTQYLAGAVFAITDSSGRLVETLITDRGGSAYTTNLLADTTYFIEEVTPPYGYKKIEGRFPLVLNSTNKFSYDQKFENEVYNGKIKLHKKNQNGKPLKGIEFTIYKGYTPIQTLTTDEKGYAESKMLPATDTYRIVETYAPPQYVNSGLDFSFKFLETEDGTVEEQNNWTMTFDKNTLTATFDVRNEEIFGKVTIEKVDSEDKTVKVKGAEFSLINRYTGEKIDTGVTDSNGICTFYDIPLVNPTVNTTQGHYYIEETSPGENHILPENTRKYFSLTVADRDFKIQFENPPYKGAIEITKVDEDDHSKKLEGAEFAIYRAEDLNAKLKTAVTGVDGIARFDDLRYGKYVIKETKASKYYWNDKINGGNDKYWDEKVEGYRVTINENNQVIPLEITNPKLQVQIKVVKYSENKQYKLGRAEFELYNAKNVLLEKIITNPIEGDQADDGTGVSKIYYAEDLGEGAYIVETKAPVGYEPSPEKHYLNFDQTSEKQIVEILKEVENKRKTPKFKLQKVDENGNGVRAKFTVDVYNMDLHKDWSKAYSWSPQLLVTTRENPIAEFTEFIKNFDYMLSKYPENQQRHAYKLRIREVDVEPGYQKLDGIIASVIYYYNEYSGWSFLAASDPGNGVIYDENTMILTAVNKQIPVKLNIVKKDSREEVYLEGAVFRITPVGKEDRAVEVTSTGDASGVTVNLPYAEEYRVEEIKAPPGYWRWNLVDTIKLEEFDENTENGLMYSYQETYLNFKMPELKIKKIGTDGYTQKPLKAEFRITETENRTGMGRSITFTTQETDGIGVVDFTTFDFIPGSSADSAEKGCFKIEEISVENEDYRVLESPIYLGWKASCGNITFSPDAPNSSLPEGTNLESWNAKECITISVENRKKDYRYQMIKQGNPDDVNRVWADVIISADGNEEKLKIESETPADVSEFFSRLTDSNGYLVRIEEKDTTVGYETVPLMSFWYYPDKPGSEKFQNITGPVSIDKEGELITIKITNERSTMRLRLKKTDKHGNLIAGATFRVTTQNPSFVENYVTTGDPNGEIFEFPYAQKIRLEEIQAPPGYELGAQSVWDLTADEFQSIDSTNSVYECNRFFTNPIVNESKYDLTIRKTDGDGQTANATFRITASGGVGKTWDAPTENGVAKLNFIIDDLLQNYPRHTKVNLEVTEIATDKGLQLREGVLATILVHQDRIRGEASGNYFDIFYYNDFIKLEGSSDVALDFTVKNEFIPVNLTVIKKEEGVEPAKYLAGAEFTITPYGSAPRILTTTNDPKGQTIKLPWAESYTVQETKAPEGYILDPTVYDYTLEDFKDQMDSTGQVLLAKNMTVSMTNTPVKGRLQVTKVDEEDNHSLTGAEFEIYEGNLNQDHTYDDVKEREYHKVGTIQIDGQGIGISEELPYGNYLLKETRAPEGYEITKEIYETKISRDKETVYIQIPNKKSEGKLTIIKEDDSEPKQRLAGAVFTVHRKDNDRQVGDKLITGPDGTISMDLPYGEYYVKEVSFPSGYASATGKKYEFELNSGLAEVEKIIPNKKTQYALRLFKTDRDTGEYLAGAVFGLYEDNADPETAEPVQRFTTNANGSAVVFLAKGGDYDIYELEPPAGYQLLTEKIEVHVDDTVPAVEIYAENVKQNLTIEIHKKDQNSKPLQGAVFEIRNAKTDALVATTDRTGTDGKVTVSVPAGDYEYTVTEIAAPEGYVLDSTPKPVTIKKEDQGGTIVYTADPVEVINNPIQGNIKLIKVDKDTRTPLEGAVFGIYDSSDILVDTLTTNSRGEAMSGNLRPGRYILKELEPPRGYQLSDTPYEAELTQENNLITVTAENTPLRGGFTVRKTDPKDPDKKLTGAEFNVYASYEDAEKQQNSVAVQTVGQEGTAVFSELAYGTYFVRETKAPGGYELNNRIFTVTVDGGSAENLVLTVENHKKPEKGIFRVRKKDKDTGSALAGAEFSVTGDSYSKTYTTGADGTFETEELDPGTYTVTETMPPKGYRISKDAVRTVTVKPGAGISSNVEEYEFFNEKIQFSVRIVKTDDNSADYKPLAGAVFELYQLNEEGLPEDTPLERLVTGIDGTALSMKLPVGKYRVQEVKAPDGYKLSETPYQDIEISEDTPQETLDFSVTFRNSPELGSLRIRKLGLPEKEADPSGGVPLAGAEFEAVKADTGEAHYAVSGEDGWAVFENLPFGIYNVRETEVPDGYESDSAYFETVEVGRKGSGSDPVVIEKTAYNYKVYGYLSLKKTDSETGNPVAGAVYGIYTALKDGDVDPDSYMDGFDLTTGVDSAYVTSKKLDLGTYYIKERVSPPGYEMNPFVYTVTITEKNPVAYIDAEDIPIKGRVTVHKKDENNNHLEGAVFALYTREDYDRIKEEIKPGEHYPDVPAIYLTTDAQGNTGTDNLTLGQEYVLTEFAAPVGYQLEFKPEFFTPSDAVREFHFEAVNKKKKELIIHKVNDSGSPVSDIMFTVYGCGKDGKPETADDGEALGILSPGITGDGIARLDISDFKNGWYYVKETQGSDMGYEVSQEIITFEITDDKMEYEFTFVNYRPKGEIEIQKKDEFGNPLPGAEFTLNIPGHGWYDGTDRNDLKEVAKFELDEKGYGIIRDIETSVYVIRETKAPAGYKPVEDILVIMHREGTKLDKNGRVYYHYHRDIVNEPITGWISVQKEAELDGQTVEGMDLSNARFEIRDKNNKLVDTLITKKDGTAVSRELPMGTYTIRETEAPHGTVLNETEKTVTIDGKGENDIYKYTHRNSVVKGQIQIHKLDGDTEAYLKGAEFDILKEGSDIPEDHLEIGENGTATSKPLPYGWYIIRETKAPDGYALQLQDIRCQIQKDKQTIEIRVKNFRKTEAEILVVKYDKDDPGHYLEGAEFMLYRDETLNDPINGPFVTDKNGKIILGADLNLQEGNTYYLKETKAPDGYKLDETVHSFTLDSEKPQSIALYIPNEKEKGYIKFEKTGEMLTGIQDDTSYPNLKELIWSQQRLENAEIGIYATEPVSLDGRTYQKGDLIQRLESGKISQPLPVGTYQYKELSAPDDYILDKEFYDIEVTKDHVEEAAALAEMANTHASVALNLHKKFKDGNTAEKLKKVVFGVYAASTIISNEIQIPKETLLGILRIDENGQSINMDLKLPQGSYYVMEIETEDGYVLDGRRYPFITDYQNRNQTVEISSAEDPIINETVYGTIRLEKTGDMFMKVEKRIEEGQPDDYQISKPVYGEGVLKGAEVEIRAKDRVTIDGATFEPGETIDRLISGEKDESIKLPLGTYILVETKAPDGYILNSEPKEVVIKKNEAAGKPSIEVYPLKNEKAAPKITLYKSFFGKTDEEAKNLYTEVLFGVYADEEIRGASNDAILKKGDLVGLIRIDETGKGTFTDDTLLPFGNYYVKELETAQGYQVSEKIYRFAVTGDNVGPDPETGENRVVSVPGISEETPVVNLPDGAEVPFAFRKIDEEGNPLAGATFRLYTCELEHTHSEEAGTEGSCWKEIRGLSPKTSGTDGIVDFGILPDGTYQLKETGAPDGYVLPAGQWRFIVNSGAEPGNHIEFISAGGVQPPAFQKADEGAAYQYQVTNRKARPMPFTGGPGLPVYMGGGSALIALSELIRRRRKRK